MKSAPSNNPASLSQDKIWATESGNDRQARIRNGESADDKWQTVLVLAVSVLLFMRLVWFTWKHAVNILFWDQWDFYQPLFQHASLWQIFHWQHGPARQGTGFLLDTFLLEFTHWDTRAEALAIVVVTFAAMLLSLYLKKRLFGRLDFTDVIIPCIFLTRSQYEMLVGASNTTWGAYPLLLIALYCLAWLQENRVARSTWIILLNFLLIYTGFGIFIGFVTPVLLTVDAYHAARSKQYRVLGGLFLTFVAAMLSLVFYFSDYKFQPNVDCFQFPYKNVWAYPQYSGLVLGNFFGLKRHGFLVSAFGIVFLLLLAGVLVHRAGVLRREGATPKKRNTIIVVLVGYSVLYSLNVAVGRVCLGPNTAQASRYIPYLMPGIVGLYFHLLDAGKSAKRKYMLAVLVAGTAFAALHMTKTDEGTVYWLSHGKREWKSCYLRTEDIEGCDRATGFKVYPVPEGTGMKEKLEYMKRNKLNLYADAK